MSKDESADSKYGGQGAIDEKLESLMTSLYHVDINRMDRLDMLTDFIDINHELIELSHRIERAYMLLDDNHRNYSGRKILKNVLDELKEIEEETE